jgi:O-methyltransferase
MLAKSDIAARYIALLKKSLINELYIENEARIVLVVDSLLNRRQFELGHLYGINREAALFSSLRKVKADGSSIVLRTRKPDGSSVPVAEMRNFTELAHTMVGRKRLDNLQYCIEAILADDVRGDFLEAGVWRGGSCIFMRGVLSAYNVSDRKVWAADSFEGVPAPTHPNDAGIDLSVDVLPVLAVPLDEVQELFSRYDLLDGQVEFLKGWFKDTLKSAPIDRLALLRLDGDLYESTMDALVPLYEKVSAGGFVIVDDYYSCAPCGRAVDEFRATRAICEPMQKIDEQSIFWRKNAA